MSNRGITEQVAKYIAQHPEIRTALHHGIVNFSALARIICNELKLSQFAAVVAALQRRAQRMQARVTATRSDVIRLLRGAKLTIRTRMCVVVIERPKDLTPIHELQHRARRERGSFQYVEGDHAIVIIANREAASAAKERFRGKLLSLEEELAQIHLLFDQRIETTVGVVAFIYSLLAERGINVLEEFSCWTDMMLLIRERDLPAALQVLST